MAELSRAQSSFSILSDLGLGVHSGPVQEEPPRALSLLMRTRAHILSVSFSSPHYNFTLACSLAAMQISRTSKPVLQSAVLLRREKRLQVHSQE